MQKTTVYLDEEAYRALQTVARRMKRTPAALVRQAVAEFAARHTRRALPRSLGAFSSGRPDLGQNADDYLAGFGESN
ncbi:MAG: CopG family ribbon-helix-helix protein [Terriglobales bacterium]